MTNHAQGHEAEKHAAKYLKQQGYRIIELNWRRPQAEIDIIARKKHGPLTFIEVKYRQSRAQGGGLDYITARKLEQMQFAAALWVAENRHDDEYVLAALELQGPDFAVRTFLPQL